MHVHKALHIKLLWVLMIDVGLTTGLCFWVHQKKTQMSRESTKTQVKMLLDGMQVPVFDPWCSGMTLLRHLILGIKLNI